MEREPLVELRDLLLASRQVADDLLEDLDVDADIATILAQLETLVVLDDSRSRVTDRLRRQVSSVRMRAEEKSTRQYVLKALDEIGSPQTTGFLEDYLSATALVEARSRGMGALRRDEYRAWTRRGDTPRVAYVVPCLDAAARRTSRWLSRSDWPLEQRLVVDDAEELWALRRITSLAAARADTTPETEALFAPLIHRYLVEALGADVVDFHSPFDAELDRAVAVARDRADDIEPRVRARQEELAATFHLDEAERLWGVERGPDDRSSHAVG